MKEYSSINFHCFYFMPNINLASLYKFTKLLIENPAVRHFGEHLFAEQASMQPFKIAIYKDKKTKFVKLVEGLNERYEEYNEDFKRSVDDYVSMELGNSQPQVDLTTKFITDFIEKSAEFANSKAGIDISTRNSISLDENPRSMETSKPRDSKKS